MCNLIVVMVEERDAAEDEGVEVVDEVELRPSEMKEEKAVKALGATIVGSLDTVHGNVQRKKRHRRLASDVVEPII